MVHRPSKSEIGIGATRDLSLRVSVAALVRVLFQNPPDGKWTLALEQQTRALPDTGGERVETIAQPFGGAVRIHDLGRLKAIIDDFHFDSEGSRLEHDFRIMIRPSAWHALRDFCTHQFLEAAEPILETDPARELAEEFAETLDLHLDRSQYSQDPVGIVIEDKPAPTANAHAIGQFSVRIYRIFEARILDHELARALELAGNRPSGEDHTGTAVPGNGGPRKGRANGVLTLPLDALARAYLDIAPAVLNSPILFNGCRLDETVAAIMDGVAVPKYRRL